MTTFCEEHFETNGWKMGQNKHLSIQENAVYCSNFNCAKSYFNPCLPFLLICFFVHFMYHDETWVKSFQSQAIYQNRGQGMLSTIDIWCFAPPHLFSLPAKANYFIWLGELLFYSFRLPGKRSLRIFHNFGYSNSPSNGYIGPIYSECILKYFKK